MNLNDLPDFNFCEKDGSVTEASILSGYEAVAKVSLAAGDPVRLFMEALALVVVTQRQVIDQTGKQNMLAFATKESLDHIGAWTDTDRLDSYSAMASIRFELSEARDYVVVIPAGTRITPDNKLMFATDKVAEIEAGKLSIDVAATCQTAGTVGNGYLAGQLNRLVDPIPAVGAVKVTNTGVTLGGAEVEKDDRYRDRIHRSPEKYSVAGAAGAYEYWALTAHQDIAHVKADTPGEGLVDVVVLMNAGELPGSDILQKVESLLSAEKKRPLNDTVRILAPEQVHYSIDLKYFVGNSNMVLLESIQQRIDAAVQNYIDWQRGALGRDINPTELIHLIRQAGAKRVEMSSPIDTSLNMYQVAALAENGLSVSYGGLEDD